MGSLIRMVKMLVNIVVQIVKGVTTFLTYLADGVVTLTETIGVLPVVFSVPLMAALSIVVIKMIIGRGE